MRGFYFLMKDLIFIYFLHQEENSENINVLSCDLCENMHFASAAEWVRHVQTHTETELAISNNSMLLKKYVS